ncbi:response regulator [Flavobacterium hercynium]|uniref:Response regulator n=1 Tax=Flavobacterium hercynium TaxID=387094 RepID=A0A226HAS3_9FLAO|nr:response regulator [Flavobacterium hercynium]OXA91282.1 response regulator [Flavobacterium hercynium]SMP12415.1 Response regulator receiver domain-containing protein [Flavobacterium hercynium]
MDEITMKKRLLIIDDDSRNIFALVNTLRSRSFDCLSCLSAEEALKLLETDEKIDAILIDMMMPEMDGYDAIPLIKKIPSRAHTLIVAVTAQAMTGDKEKCLEAGADDYVSKPIDVDKLLAALSQI